MSADTDTRTDTKSGYCSMCRSGSHALCGSPSCRCRGGTHPNRPDAVARRRAAPSNGSASRVMARDASRAADGATTRQKAKVTEPVWELVKADPPAPPPKPQRLTLVERARPFLEELMAQGNHDWHRVVVFPSSMAAGQATGRLRKAYREFEWKGCRVPDIGQSAVYVKWTGGKAKSL